MASNRGSNQIKNSLSIYLTVWKIRKHEGKTDNKNPGPTGSKTRSFKSKTVAHTQPEVDSMSVKVSHSFLKRVFPGSRERKRMSGRIMFHCPISCQRVSGIVEKRNTNVQSERAPLQQCVSINENVVETGRYFIDAHTIVLMQKVTFDLFLVINASY